jgi:hypothetical protein
MSELFVGLKTWDFLSLVDRFPERNQKILAPESVLSIFQKKKLDKS